jgi:WD40 repeat protein
MRRTGLPSIVVLGWGIFGSSQILAENSNPLELILQTPPAASVRSVVFSPDGSTVATGAGEGGVRLYDAQSGALLRVIGEVGDRSVSFTPDGRALAAAGYHMDKLVGLFDVRTGKRLRTFAGHTEWETYATAISPDGASLASAGSDRQLLVWDLSTGALRYRIETKSLPVTALAFSPDGATLAGGCGNEILLWDTDSGREIKAFDGHADVVCTVAFSSDGGTIAGGSCDWKAHRGHDWPRPEGSGPERSEWRIWDATTGDLKRTVEETGRLLALALAPDGNSLACGLNNDVMIYDLSAEAPGRVVKTFEGIVTSVAFSPDGQSLLGGSHDQTVRRVSLVTGEADWEAPGAYEQVNSVAVSPDGSLLATGSGDHRFARGTLKAGRRGLGPGAVRLWDLKTGRSLRQMGDPNEQIMAVAVSHDGRIVAGGGGSPDGAGVVRLWECASGSPLWTSKPLAAEALALSFAPDGSSLAAACADGLVHLLDPRTGALLRTLEGHAGGATSVVFSPDSSILVCAEGQGGVRIWEPQTGELLRTCKAKRSHLETDPNDRLMTTITLTPDGGTVAVCGSSVNNLSGDPVRFWNLRTGEIEREFADEKLRGRPTVLSPDGSLVATGGKSIKLWDARNGKLVRELFGRLKRTQSIVFTADGKFVIAGGSYGTTNIWEVSTGNHLVTLFAFNDVATGEAAEDWLAYGPDSYYDGSPGVERFLAWRLGADLLTPETVGARLRRPDRIESALRLDPGNPSVP